MRAQDFRDAYKYAYRRIELLAKLPMQSLDRMSLKRQLDEFGKTEDSEATAP